MLLNTVVMDVHFGIEVAREVGESSEVDLSTEEGGHDASVVLALGDTTFILPVGEQRQADLVTL